jgi:hypothetical protein
MAKATLTLHGRDLDFQKPYTVEGFLVILWETIDQYRCDASNLDASDMDGRPWAIIADELERAYARIEQRVRRVGYPLAGRVER